MGQGRRRLGQLEVSGGRGLAQDGGQPRNRGTERVPGRGRVADDQGLAEFLLACTAARQALERQPADGGTRHDVVLGLAGREADEHMQAGGDAGDLHTRDLAGQRADQAVAALAVGEPGPPYLPVVATRANELGQR